MTRSRVESWMGLRYRLIPRGGSIAAALIVAACTVGCHRSGTTADTTTSTTAMPSAAAPSTPDVAAKVQAAMQTGAAFGRRESDFHRSHPPTAGGAR